MPSDFRCLDFWTPNMKPCRWPWFSSPWKSDFQDRLHSRVLKISLLNGVPICHHPYITSDLRKLWFENEGVLLGPWKTGRRSFWSKASLLRLQVLSGLCAASLLCRRQQGRGKRRKKAVWCSGQPGRQVSVWAGQRDRACPSSVTATCQMAVFILPQGRCPKMNFLDSLVGHLRGTDTSGEQLIPFHYSCDELLFWCADLHRLQRNPSLMTNVGWDESYHPSEVSFLWKMPVSGKWKRFV